MKLTISNILIFYDVPQLFIAYDEASSKYLCIGIDETRYIAMQISPDKLYRITSWKLDLKTAFSHSENGHWYFGEIIEQKIIDINISNIITSLTEEYLPDEWCYLPANEEQEDKDLLLALEMRQNPLMEVSISDEEDNTSISLWALSDFSDKFQSMYHYAYRKVVAMTSWMEKDAISDSQNSIMRAYAISPWSFKIHLEVKSTHLTFGESAIEIAFKNIDTIFDDSLWEEELIWELRKNKWHLLSSVKRFLEMTSDQNIVFKYKWVWQGYRQVSTRKLSKQRITYLNELLSNKNELTQEIKEFIGTVQMADTKWDWRIFNLEDEIEYHWTYPEWLREKIEVQWSIYRFLCEEIIEEFKVSEKTKVKYILLSYEKIDVTS